MQSSFLAHGVGPLFANALEQLVEAHKAEMTQFICKIAQGDDPAKSEGMSSQAEKPRTGGLSHLRMAAAPRMPKEVPCISPRGFKAIEDDTSGEAARPAERRREGPLGASRDLPSSGASSGEKAVQVLPVVEAVHVELLGDAVHIEPLVDRPPETQATRVKKKNRQTVIQNTKGFHSESSKASSMAVPVASNIPGVQLGIGYISESDSQDSHERQNVLGVSEASAVIGEFDVAPGTDASEVQRELLSRQGSMDSCSTTRLTFRQKISAQIELEGAEAVTEESSKEYEAIIKGETIAGQGMPDDSFSRCVQHVAFESVFIGLIILNTLTIIAEVQYVGIDIGHHLQHPSSPASAADTWPGVEEMLEVTDFGFGVLFTVEVIVKVLALRKGFFSSGWNLFDSAIVLLWLLAKFVAVKALGDNPTVLRFMRLMRVMRVIRLFRWIQSLDSLHILIKSIQASSSMIVWAFLLLSIMITMSSLAVTHFAVPFLEDETRPLQQRLEVYRYFGTFTRSAVSMFEVTLGNFGPIMRSLTENVDEAWGMFFVVYKAVGGFSVVSVITGVFLHETFGVADHDPGLMVITARRQQASHLKKMTLLFAAADRTGLGALSFTDFSKLFADPFVKTWLAAYELNVFDVALLWDLVDDGDDCLTAEELLTGIARLKGSARSLDLHELMQDIEGMGKSVEDILTRLMLAEVPEVPTPTKLPDHRSPE